MNWFDYLLLAIIAAGAVAGMRLGVIGAAFMAVGGLVGWMLAGRLSDDVGGLLSSVAGDTWVTSLSYVVIVGLSVVIAAYVWRRLAGPLLMAATMGMSGMVNKLGGVALGIVIGATVSFALIVVSARLTYDFQLPDGGVARQRYGAELQGVAGGRPGRLNHRVHVRGRRRRGPREHAGVHPVGLRGRAEHPGGAAQLEPSFAW